jgi:transglutaminase-like putative cysteine protease
MKRALATGLVLAQVLLASGCGHNGGSDSGDLANQAAIYVAAPCPAPDQVDALAGIEGWAPGAGQASKMGSNAQQMLGGMGGLGGGAPDTPTAPPSAAANACKSLSPALTGTLAKVAADRKALPTTGSDVAARAALLTTPDAAFAFVRDAIRTDAYAGSMRGSRGTLMSAAGSSADKALLLHDLLAAQNVPSRFVHATLADADATAVAALATTPTKIDDASVLSGALAKQGLTDGIATAKASLNTMNALLSGAHQTFGANDAIATLQANVRDHWWLQAQIGGTWTDMDPTLPSAKSGTHVGPTPTDPPDDALPDAVNATVTVRLLADTGGSTPQVLATTTDTAADALEAPIDLTMNGDASDMPAVATQTSFVPSVSIGDKTASGDAFAPDGGARLRALYLEVATTMPGGAPRVHRQVVVDRRSADGSGIDAKWTPARTAYAMTFAYRGVESVGDLDPYYSMGVNIDAMLRGALAADYAAQHPTDLSVPEAATSTYPYEAHRFFGYDQSIRGAMTQADPTLAWVYDHPMVALYEQTFDQRADGLKLVQSFDIVDNGMVAFAGGNVAADRNAERGLMDTSVEGTLVSGPGVHLDTAAVFAAAQSQTLGVLTPADIAKAPFAARDALTSGLSATTVAIAPPAGVSVEATPVFGWLEVDTKTGNTVGRLQSGAGQAMTERSILEKAVEKYSAIKALGRCINCFFSAMGEAFVNQANGTQRNVDPDFGKCMANALCQFAVDWAFDWMAVHGFEMEGTGYGLATGAYLDIAGEIIGNGPTGAICNGVGPKNPYSRPILG